MKGIIHQAKLVTIIGKAFLQAHSAYRLAALMWIVNGFITPLLLLTIWLTIRQNNSLAYDQNQFITYYFLVVIVTRLTQSWSAESLGRKIKEGDLARHLVQPISFLNPEIAADIAYKTIRLISLLPFVLIVILFWRHHLVMNLSALNIGLFTLAIIFGYILSLLSETCIGLLSFWLEHYEGVYTMFSLTRELLSGFMVPLALMPSSLQHITRWSPFRYFLSYPIEIITTHSTQTQISQGFLGMAIWLVILTALVRYLYSQGVKKFTAAGI